MKSLLRSLGTRHCTVYSYLAFVCVYRYILLGMHSLHCAPIDTQASASLLFWCTCIVHVYRPRMRTKCASCTSVRGRRAPSASRSSSEPMPCSCSCSYSPIFVIFQSVYSSHRILHHSVYCLCHTSRSFKVNGIDVRGPQVPRLGSRGPRGDRARGGASCARLGARPDRSRTHRQPARRSCIGHLPDHCALGARRPRPRLVGRT